MQQIPEEAAWAAREVYVVWLREHEAEARMIESAADRSTAAPDYLFDTTILPCDEVTAPTRSPEHKGVHVFSLDEAAGLRMPDGCKRSIADWARRLAMTDPR